MDCNFIVSIKNLILKTFQSEWNIIMNVKRILFKIEHLLL